MDYKLVRGDRKTLAVYVNDDGEVEVRAPRKLSVRNIENFLDANEKRIHEIAEMKRRRSESRAAFSLGFGSRVRLLGAEYPIAAREGEKCGFDGKEFFFPAKLTDEDIKLNLINLYKLIAQKTLTQRAAVLCVGIGVHPQAVKVNSAKTRWGSCSPTGSLNFSWRLIQADSDTVDYVVVHELAHIKEHNHSDRFWALVAAAVPDYKDKKNNLRTLQESLSLEDWD